MTSTALRDLRSRLAGLTIRDEYRLRRRLDRAGAHDLDRLAADIAVAEQRIQLRRAAVPALRYPPQLPISVRRDDIAAAIAAHQVVVVAGETGSGKTTQLPKICLGTGRGVRGTIGHTQPRRLAARSVAQRLAEELDTDLGETVGYTVRFTDRVGEHTLVKLMTDGILLAEIRHDRLLRRYDTIIIDEAHERSLTIDFLLGYLKQLLPKRPDLKVIITSATIDPALFAAHFAARDGEPAPIVAVSGRSYPVELRYRPLVTEPSNTANSEDDTGASATDPVDAIGQAVTELLGHGDGDVLVFLSGEREIRDTADALRELRLPRTEIVPLYARLSAAEQQRVFQPHTGRRVILATNVAETSLTVPGIRYVVDPGTARISRYSLRTKVQRLPIEPISQASARQRAGRCGRVADGICIRLYSEADFDARPQFTEPEILRTNLAAVILQMTALGIGDIANFPFVTAPDRRAVRDGVALLEELGALVPSPSEHRQQTLTAVGRDMAQLPVDPRMARMLVAAQQQGCLAEVLVIVSALSIQDVRERPAQLRQAADTAHARFTVAGSDFLAWLRLWDQLRKQRKSLSGNQFRRWCRDGFLHYQRVREWQDLHEQLRSITLGLGWTAPGELACADTPLSTPLAGDEVPWDGTAVHQSLLAGMLSHIGVRQADTQEFLGARGTKFMVHPGSSLAGRPPRWVMAAELVETTRLWSRTVARIEPQWVEGLAGDLLQRSYSEPHWSPERGTAVAYLRATLYGVPVVTRRRVDLAPVDAPLARELLLRHALVEGQWQTRHEFFHRNQQLLAEITNLEDRARRRDLLVDDQVLFDFYDQLVPAEVVSVRHFDSWWRREQHRNPTLLDFTAATVVRDTAELASPSDFPDSWRQQELTLPLSYRFEPGAPDDGVTVTIALAHLGHVQDVGFDWLVPGLRPELATALLATLPKRLRRSVIPAALLAKQALAQLTARAEPLRVGLAREVSRLAGVAIDPADLDPTALPEHLRMSFAVNAADGALLARGKDLGEIKTQLAQQVSQTIAATATAVAHPPTWEWTADGLGTLPDLVRYTVAGQAITGYPALVAEPDGVAMRVQTAAAAAARATAGGVRALLLHRLPTSPRAVTAGLSTADRLALSQHPHASLDELLADCRACAANEVLAAHGALPRSPTQFEALVAEVSPTFGATVAAVVKLVVPVLAQAHRVASELSDRPHDATTDDVREQLAQLVFPGFVADIGSTRLRELPRYLQAAALRLQALPGAADRDHRAMRDLDRLRADYRALLDALPEAARTADNVTEIAWMLQELRVSLFAQHLRTRYPVSAKRIDKALADAAINTSVGRRGD